jgi:hypothetical protein
MRGIHRSVAALAIVCVAGCNSVKRPYDTPRARVDGDQAVKLLRREVERLGVDAPSANADKVATQTPSGRYAWLVRLSSDDSSDAVCGYVWRGEEAGRADGTVIRIRFDRNCRHWTY